MNIFTSPKKPPKSIKKGLLYKQLKSPKMCTKSIKLGFWQYRQKKSPFKSFLSNFILYSLMETYLKNYKPLETIFS